MDKKDNAIIELLKENSRYSIRDIAKKTGIRPSTVHHRILRLKQGGVIERFTVKLDDVKVGEGFTVFMLIKTKPESEIDARSLKSRHVKEVFGVTGEHDLLMKLKFKDVQEFNDYILKFRKEQKLETYTMVATAKIKEEI